MNRRSSIASILGKKPKQKVTSKPVMKQTASPKVVLNAGLEPYTGPFDFTAAAHLLRRVTFGPTRDQINQAVADGLEVTMQKVLTIDPVAELPVNTYYDADPNCAIGETWINAPYIADDEVRVYRERSIVGWTGGLLFEDSISIREKMVLFWHNHFVTSDIEDPKFVYNYSNRLREHALGNFRDFVKAMIIDPSMLRYLNGNQNIASAPNENFARELLELFTIGKGDVAGPGDYTFYTEEDIQEISKALTGWYDQGYFAWDNTPVGSDFEPTNHDTTTKTLSNRFGNATIQNAGNQEYSNVVDIIFQQDEVAKFIVRKLYRWFIYYDITDQIEQDIITPLANQFRDGDYQIFPIINTLLRSAHFFGDEAAGCIIKNPIDFSFSLARQFKMEFSTDLDKRYRQQGAILQNAGFLQMAYYRPPNVAGWKAYYQEPVFHQIWLNSVTLPQRMGYAWVALNLGFDVIENGTPEDLLIVDPLIVVDELDTPSDVNAMISQLVEFVLPKPITATQKIYLKNVLIPGLPDFEWEVEYLEYAVDPTNEALAQPVRSKLKNMFTVLVTMAEYQLM